MPTVFDLPDDGDVTHVAQINQYAPAVTNLERGLAFSAGTTSGTATAYTATVTPGPADNEFGTILIVYWHVDCGTDPTLALNGHAALSIWKTEIAKVAAGELKSGTFSILVCNGTKWFVLQQLGGSAGSTNASSAFSSGQVPLARGGTGADLSATGGAGQFVRQNSAGGVLTVSAIAAGDLPNHSAALLTSGTLALARGGVGADLSATGGTGQFLKQTSSGGAVTVATIAAGDLPNHSTSLLTSGQLALARGGTGADLSATGGTGQVLKQNSSGGAITVGALTYTDVGAAAASHNHAASEITSGTLVVARGGTGLGSLGSALQQIRVNAGGTALEFFTDSASGLPTDGSGAMTGALIMTGPVPQGGASVMCQHTSNTTDRLYWNVPAAGYFTWTTNNTNSVFQLNASNVNCFMPVNLAAAMTAPSSSNFGMWRHTTIATVVQAPAAATVRTLVAPTSVPNTSTATTIASVSGMTQCRILVEVDGMGAIMLSWDGTTLAIWKGLADTNLVVSGSPGAAEVGFGMSSANLQAKHALGAAKNCTVTFMPGR